MNVIFLLKSLIFWVTSLWSFGLKIIMKLHHWMYLFVSQGQLLTSNINQFVSRNLNQTLPKNTSIPSLKTVNGIHYFLKCTQNHTPSACKHTISNVFVNVLCPGCENNKFCQCDFEITLLWKLIGSILFCTKAEWDLV